MSNLTPVNRSIWRARCNKEVISAAICAGTHLFRLSTPRASRITSLKNIFIFFKIFTLSLNKLPSCLANLLNRCGLHCRNVMLSFEFGFKFQILSVITFTHLRIFRPKLPRLNLIVLTSRRWGVRNPPALHASVFGQK